MGRASIHIFYHFIPLLLLLFHFYFLSYEAQWLIGLMTLQMIFAPAVQVLALRAGVSSRHMPQLLPTLQFESMSYASR